VPSGMEVFAAGAVCWRESGKDLLVAIIHRGRYQDWTFPKGKVDPGETLAEAAVREVREETGLKVKLGVPLTTVSYPLDKDKTKVVHYWATKVSDKALSKSKFKPDEEVSEVLWLKTDEAFAKLSYQHDRDLLDEVLELRKNSMLKTKPLIIIRHAHATPRADYVGEDGKRPLLPEGKKQAKELVRLLSAYGPKRVFTSPWRRCKDTITPYAKAHRYKIIDRGELSEMGNAKGPARTAKVAKKLFLDARSSVLCTHRPTLPTITKVLADFAEPKLAKLILEAKALKPGEFIVLHLTTAGKKPRLVAVEQQSLEERL
jgi:8-oxo-dGTP pyrophosphatase MutT (NUDIX family)/phosphohistidine phosphatase SixA